MWKYSSVNLILEVLFVFSKDLPKKNVTSNCAPRRIFLKVLTHLENGLLGYRRLAYCSLLWFEAFPWVFQFSDNKINMFQELGIVWIEY